MARLGAHAQVWPSRALWFRAQPTQQPSGGEEDPLRVGLDLPPSSVFGKRYRISRRVGAGGFGSVYEATHLVTGRPCALKVLLPHLAKDQKFRDGFLRESRVTAQIQSSNIVDVLDAGIDEETDTPFIVMELLEGEDLSKRLKRKTRFTAEETAVYLAQVGLALDQTHRHSIIHRDLKPPNLFLTRGDDGGPLIKILDFGIAKALAAQSIKATQGAGTPLYMAPEQFRGESVTPMVDVYAVGMLAFIFLAGQHYYKLERRQGANALKMAMAIVGGPSQPASVRAKAYEADIPTSFDPWFAKISHPDPKQRFSGAKEAAIELCRCLGVAVPEQLLAERTAPKIGALTAMVDAANNPLHALRNSMPQQPPVSAAETRKAPYSNPTVGAAGVPLASTKPSASAGASAPASDQLQTQARGQAATADARAQLASVDAITGMPTAVATGASAARPQPKRKSAALLMALATAGGLLVLLLIAGGVLWSRSSAQSAEALTGLPATEEPNASAASAPQSGAPAPEATGAAAETDPKPEATQEPTSEKPPTSEPQKSSTPEASPIENRPASRPKPKSDPKPSAKPQSKPKPKPTPKPKPETPDDLYSRE